MIECSRIIEWNPEKPHLSLFSVKLLENNRIPCYLKSHVQHLGFSFLNCTHTLSKLMMSKHIADSHSFTKCLQFPFQNFLFSDNGTQTANFILLAYSIIFSLFLYTVNFKECQDIQQLPSINHSFVRLQV